MERQLLSFLNFELDITDADIMREFAPFLMSPQRIMFPYQQYQPLQPPPIFYHNLYNVPTYTSPRSIRKQHQVRQQRSQPTLRPRGNIAVSPVKPSVSLTPSHQYYPQQPQNAQNIPSLMALASPPETPLEMKHPLTNVHTSKIPKSSHFYSTKIFNKLIRRKGSAQEL